MVSDTIDVVVVAIDDDMEPTDASWSREADTLVNALGPDARLATSIPQGGTKGAVSDIVLSLGTSGAITGAVTVLRQWLGQRANRRVTLTLGGDQPVRIELDSHGVSDKSVRELLAKALERANADD
jgi:hypothetical protein